jgi:hypothetical protein
MIIGIDPGKKGSVCLMTLSGVISNIWLMPLDSAGKLDFGGVWRIFCEMPEGIARVGIERLLSFPSDCSGDRHVDGRIGTMTMGINWGVLIGCIVAKKYPFEVINPRTWQAVMCKNVDQSLLAKAKAEIVAKRLFPNQNWLIGKSRKPHDGAIDAALIAEYTRLRYTTLGGNI